MIAIVMLTFRTLPLNPRKQHTVCSKESRFTGVLMPNLALEKVDRDANIQAISITIYYIFYITVRFR